MVATTMPAGKSRFTAFYKRNRSLKILIQGNPVHRFFWQETKYRHHEQPVPDADNRVYEKEPLCTTVFLLMFYFKNMLYIYPHNSVNQLFKKLQL